MFAKTFRNTLFASTLVVAGSVLVAPAMADTVEVGGSVAKYSSVTSTPTGAASILNLYGVGTAQDNVVVHVANLALITNHTSGVTLTATPDAGMANTGTILPYQVLIVDDGASAPADTAFAAGAATDTVNDFTDGAAARDLYIEYDAPAVTKAGGYLGVITVTVANL